MSLKWYLRQRLVALGPDALVMEAARAMENSNIGAAIVLDKGKVAGIITDRDLAVRVVGRALDPNKTTLAEVMTKGVATLSPSDSQMSALRLMQKRNIRRIPLVDEDRLVGIVTLDDLLLDEAASIDHLAAVVQGQIGEGGAAETPRSPARRRSASGGNLYTSPPSTPGGGGPRHSRTGGDRAGSRPRVRRSAADAR